MPAMTLVLNVEETGLESLLRVVERTGCTDMAELIERGEVIYLQDDAVPQVGVMPAGMQSGAPAVSIAFNLPDGKAVVLETSLALFLSAADAFKAAYGDPRHAGSG